MSMDPEKRRNVIDLLRHLARDSRRYDVNFLSGVEQLTAGRLRRADAIVFVNTSGELPLSTTQKAPFLRFVRSGKGFVSTHSASDTLYGWPEYSSLFGGEFQEHPFVGEGRVVVVSGQPPAGQWRRGGDG